MFLHASYERSKYLTCALCVAILLFFASVLKYTRAHARTQSQEKYFNIFFSRLNLEKSTKLFFSQTSMFSNRNNRFLAKKTDCKKVLMLFSIFFDNKNISNNLSFDVIRTIIDKLSLYKDLTGLKRARKGNIRAGDSLDYVFMLTSLINTSVKLSPGTFFPSVTKRPLFRA